MEEVPASPEIVKRKKIRRKHGSSFTRLSFQQRAVNNVTKHSPAKSAVDCSPTAVFGSTPRRKLSTFYFDDGSAEIETVDADPLASAILLEKANTISAQSRVPSPDFIAATAEEFLSAAELAKRANANPALNHPKVCEHSKSNEKNHNYSFTQLELDSQMINIFEAAEQLAGAAREDQKKEPDGGAQMLSSLEAKIVEEIIARRKQTVSAPTCERTLVQSIVDDFSEDDGFSWAIDYSVIKTENLRLRLLQLQDYSASPPRAVKREAVPCRHYRNAKRLPPKDPPARRLSYGTDCSSRVEQPLSDDEIASPSERDVPDGDGTDISMEGVALNESVLIQANLTQLSAFFSQTIERSSIDGEPPFYGFTPDPASPISLGSNDERSPRALRLEFRPFECFEDDSIPSAEDNRALTLPAKCPQIEQLLDDDEDLFMLAQPPSEEQILRSSRHENAFRHSNEATSRSRGLPVTDESNPLNGFIRPQVPISVSNAALLRAEALFAEEQANMSMASTVALNVENETPSKQEVRPVVPPAGSLTVVQLGKVNKCESTSSVERHLPLERVSHAVSVEPLNAENHHQMAQPSNTSQVVFSTAGGKPIAISGEALAKARTMFAEEEPKACCSKLKVDAPKKNPLVDKVIREHASNVSLPFGSVFSTASGKPIAISKEALIKARTMFAEEETKTSGSKHRLEAVEKNQLVDDVIMEDASNPTLPFAGVLSTASGKPIAISVEALAKARTMFAEEEPKACCSKLKVDATEKNPLVNEVIMEDPSNLSLHFAGVFSTASGKPIAISGEALAKARKMFAEDDLKEFSNKHHLEAAEKNPQEDKVITKHASNHSLPFAGVYSTDQIAISKCALAKAQHIFDEEVMSMGKENLSRNTILSVSGGVYNANGSSISVSKKAFEMVNALFEEEKTNTLDQEPASVGRDQRLAVAFGTAGGSSITVTKQALDRAAKDLFADDEELAKMIGISKETIALPQNSTVETVLPFVHVEQGLATESHRKRKPSVSQEEPMTPTKRPRMNHLQPVGGLQTSTPAAALLDTPKPAADGREMEQFFAELDDEEFEELFRNQQQPANGGAKRQNRLLSRFEQCAAPEETTANTSHTSHWDDSFTEILPKLPSDERRKATSACPAEEVQRKRRAALQKQREFIDSKPEELRRPRVSTFCSKKRRTDRVGLQQFVGESRPTPSVAISAAMSVTLDNAVDFRFDMVDYCGETVCSSNTTGIPVGSDAEAVLLLHPLDSSVGLEEMRQCFLASPGIDPRLVPAGWVENAWRWIVSKLAALERNLEAYCRGALTPENVFHQLQYRYHLEIDCSRRPPLRKMLEKDDIASRRMVLFVSNVFPGGEGSIVGCELELSDGWYAVRTVIDVPLAGAVRAGKIAIGTKLMIQGGELLNHRDGCSPLEVPPEVRLKIHANSTRRVRWPVKLGYCRWPVPFLIPCHGIHERGGLIGRFRACVVRVYPLVYVEKVANESHGSVLRSERMQRRHSSRIDANQRHSLRTLYHEIEQEIERERAAAVSRLRDVRVTESTPCSQLQELLEGGLEVSFLDFELTLSQQAVVKRFQQQRQEELQTEINRRVRAQTDNRCNRASATSLLKVRLMDAVKPDRAFVLSIWRPTDEVRFVMQEQHFLELRTITANGSKNGEVQLTAHKSSTYARLPAPPAGSPAVLGERFSRAITPIGDIDPRDVFRPPFNEFDTIGVVVHVGTADSKKFQSIYLADTAMELLCVNFWHGLAEYAYDDVVHERAILCVANLQWRTIGRQNQAIVQSFATEYTTFTENPRSGQQRAEWDRFRLQLGAIDGEEFFQRCREKVRDLKDAPASGSFSTPLQQHRSVSRLAPPCHSTPLAGAGGSMAKRKMESLAAICGSPPALSPIVIRSHPSARKGFRTPARLEDSSLGAPPSDADDSVG